MKPEPYPGAGLAGDATSGGAALTFPLADRSFMLFRDLAQLSAGAGVALCALAANHALHGQVSLAYRVAGYARAQSRTIADMYEAAVPAGPAREALLGTARLVESFADELAASASRYGRTFGHLAFAFPVTAPGA